VAESLVRWQLRAPDWLHLLALTLLNAHPALTGTIYGIRYAPQIGSTCWRSLYSMRIQRSLAPSMESGTRPKFTPTAVAHFTKHASSAHWHHIWNQVRTTDWLHLLALTLLNAHPALTGTIYGIRYAPQTGSTCWRSLY
jgi:hypothetical protein